ncbi:MAG: hypothetical protein K0S16_1458 [Moraxellaceae bacterium]|jgi:hypothetical protein|nr:hypothetical protein [Moraxellaceae bacterium]
MFSLLIILLGLFIGVPLLLRKLGRTPMRRFPANSGPTDSWSSPDNRMLSLDTPMPEGSAEDKASDCGSDDRGSSDSGSDCSSDSGSSSSSSSD